MLFGALPLGTKIYLENKSLVNIENLRVGDKVLSLKIDDSDIKNSKDFYLKYVLSDNMIELNNLEVSSATVSKVNILKDRYDSFYYSKSMYVNNPIIARVIDNKISVSHVNDKKRELFNISNTEYKKIKDFKTYELPSYSEDIVNKILTGTETDISFKMTASPYISISLKDNYFYFSENLCLVGIVPEFFYRRGQ